MKSKTTEQLTKDLENIIKGLYKNEDMETVRKIVEKVLSQTEMDRDDSEKEPDNSKKARILGLLKELKGQGEVKDECQCSLSYVSIIARENKIYSKRRVTILIKNGESPEKIAQEGNINLDAVVKLKEELDKAKEKDGKSSKEEKGKDLKSAKVIELAKDLIEDGEIAEKVQCTKSYSYHVRSKEKIYSKQKVSKMLADGISAEDIALEGNVNLDAVIKLAEQQKGKKKVKPEKKGYSLVPKEIANMAAKLIPPKDIEVATYTSISNVYSVMRSRGIYSIRKVTELIQLGKSPEEIAQEENVNLDAVVKLKEELDKRQESKEKDGESTKNSKSTKEEKDLKSIKIIELAKNLIEDKEIAEKVQCARTYSAWVRSKEKIYAKRKVLEMLADGIPAEDIAKEGNVNIDAVIKLKDELEESKKNQDSNRHGAIYGRRKIIALIQEGKTNEEIAYMGNVSEERVAAIREQLQQESHDIQQQEKGKNDSGISAKSVQGESVRKLPKQYSNTTKNDTKNATILRMAYQIKSVEKIVSALGVSEYTIRNQLRAAGIYTREQVIALIRAGEKTDEEIAEESSTDVNEVKAIRGKMLELSRRLEKDKNLKRALEMLQEGSYSISTIKMQTKKKREELEILSELFVESKEKAISPEKRRVEFKIEMMQLTSSVKSGVIDTRVSRDVNDGRIQKILYKYHELLTPEDYACMAYAYTRNGDYVRAIELAEEHLGLETPSLNGLKEKIQDVLGVGKEERTSEELLSSKVVSQYTKPKAGNVGGDDGEHSGR